MNRTTVIVLIAVAVIAGIMLWGKPSAQITGEIKGDGNPASALAAGEVLYDFGRIRMADGKVEKIFTVTNTSGSDVTLEKITTSCMCTVAYLESAGGEKGPFGMPGHGGPSTPVEEALKPGESRRVRVVFDPNAHGPAGIGPVNRSIYLASRSGGELELRIKAVVTP